VSRVGAASRAVMSAVFTIAASACERAGPDSVWALQAVPDTVEARRVELPLSPLTPNALAPSPNGTEFAGAGENGDLVVASLDGTIRHLAPATREAPWGPPGYVQTYAFSRDGRRIAYGWYNDLPGRSPAMDLRVIDASGGEPRIIYGASGTFGYLTPVDWSPDGRSVVVIEEREDRTVQIVLVPVDGGDPSLVRALDWRAPQTVSFSPDGRFLAYDLPISDESHDRGLFVYEVESGRERPLLEGSGSRILLGWSRDGRIVYNELSGTPAVWGVEMEGGRPRAEPRMLKPDFWRSTGLGLTGAGDLYYTVRTGGSLIAAATLDPATGRVTGTPRPLTSRDVPGNFITFSVSSDGRLLTFAPGGPARGVVLSVRPLEGGEGREFELPPRINYGLRRRWLPDGTGIAFVGAEQGRFGLFRMDAPSGEVRRLLEMETIRNPGTFAFDFTPDGRSLVYRAQLESEGGVRREEIRVRDLRTETERVVATLEGWGDGQAQYLAVSKDGELVAFHDPMGRYRNMETDSSGTLRRAGGVDLWVMPLSGGEPRVLARTGGGPMLWSGDGRAVLVSDNALGDEVVRVPLAGGEPSRTGIRSRNLLHVDGSRLIYLDEGQGSRFELWLLQLGSGR
jgi:Tol biopolymer transport system component